MVDVEEFLYLVFKVRGDQEGCVAADRGCTVIFVNVQYHTVLFLSKTCVFQAVGNRYKSLASARGDVFSSKTEITLLVHYPCLIQAGKHLPWHLFLITCR